MVHSIGHKAETACAATTEPAHRHRIITLSTAGAVRLTGVSYKVDGRLACEQVLVVINTDNNTVADLDGEVLIEHTRPEPGVRYVGNGRPRGPHPKPSQKS